MLSVKTRGMYTFAPFFEHFNLCQYSDEEYEAKYRASGEGFGRPSCAAQTEVKNRCRFGVGDDGLPLRVSKKVDETFYFYNSLVLEKFSCMPQFQR